MFPKIYSKGALNSLYQLFFISYQLLSYLFNSVLNISDNTVIDTPIIKILKVLLGFKTTEKKTVPSGIKRIATEKIIPKTLPRNSLSTSL